MTRPDPNDTEYTDEVIDKVEREGNGYAVTRDGWTLWLSDDQNESGVVPKAGDTMRSYGRGWGSPVRGVLINGQVVRYRTADEQRRADREASEKYKADQKAKAEVARPETEGRVAALPDVLRARIEKFRKANRDFWWEFESYELFTCEQAVVFADALRDPVTDRAGYADRLNALEKLSWDEQKKRIPAMAAGHSGNTFGTAMLLAFDLLTDAPRAAREHGALSPLVGCREYGCPHPEAVAGVTP